MRVKGFQKENGGIRVELDEGQLLFWSVKNNIVRCIYTKEEVVRQGSPLGIQAGYRFDLQARNRAEALEISNVRRSEQRNWRVSLAGSYRERFAGRGTQGTAGDPDP